MVWGISYGKKTESYTAIHQSQRWSTNDFLLNLPLSEISATNYKTYKEAGLWKSIHNKKVSESVISVAAERKFKAGRDG